MLEYARKARNIAMGRRREDLDRDEVLQLALTRAVEVIGEAAGRISDATRNQHSEIPWRDIVGMRNRLIHGYDAVDANLLWDTVTVDLPPLIEALERILGEKK
ncbi:MAG: hypothetical protein DDG59_05190 [Anaerolineae bacterium]|jgi:uncharacterized protein with HEPN domain|nr:MAG: hypothetical protein DDG59_05190 [Anaerolineae bacterium]